LQQVSKLKFDQNVIHAISGVFTGTHSGWPGRQAMSIPLKIPATDGGTYYRRDREFVATVAHELAHRLVLKHGIVAPQPAGFEHDIEAHQHIFLFLPDAWRHAYPLETAEQLIHDEIEWGAADGYIPPAMAWAESLGAHKRQEVLLYLRSHKRLPPDQTAETVIGRFTDNRQASTIANALLRPVRKGDRRTA